MTQRISTRILAMTLAVIMLLLAMPLSVIAQEIGDVIAQDSPEEPASDSELTDSSVDVAGDGLSPVVDSEESDPPVSSEQDNHPVGDIIVTADTFQLRLNADQKSYTIVGWLSSGTTMEIPASYRGLPITRIEEFAFQNKKNLTTVIFSDSITYVGTEAFSGCHALQCTGYAGALYLPSTTNDHFYLLRATGTGITDDQLQIHPETRFVASYAFQNCRELTSIVVPSSVIQIGFKAFRHTDKLVSITLPFCGETGNGTENAHFGYVFGAQTYGGNISYVPTALTSIHIMGGERMVKNAFYGIDFVEELTVPFVGDKPTGATQTHFSYIFGGDSCTDNGNLPASLTKVTVAGGDAIGKNAFYGCIALTEVVIPDSVTSVGDDAFSGCRGVIQIEGGVHYVDKWVVGCDTSVTRVSLRSDTKGIGDDVFYGCSGLTSITIPDSVTSIGSSAFYGCSGLTNITIPFVGASRDTTSDTHFGYIFGASSSNYNDSYVPTSLKTVVITDATSIGDGAFSGCSGLTSITIPDSVTSIGLSAFYGCSSLTSITIPNSVTSIGDAAFFYCRGLTSITIPDSVTSIGNSAFSSCSGLTSITIPDSVTSIGNRAFEDCGGLTSITIPDSVTSIGNSAFYDCSGLTTITIPFVGASRDTTSDTHFGYIFGASSSNYNDSYVPTSLKTVVITDATSIGDYAFSGCSGLTSITIPDSVTSIGSWAFYYCSGLTGVYISDLVSWCNISFSGSDSNPLYYAHNLYLNGEPVTDLVIPNSVTYIGNWAFSGCSGLTSITIPNSVTSIGDRAFYNCSSLTSIHVDPANTVYHSAGNCLIHTADCILIAGCMNSIIPADGSVTSIGDDAFFGCSGLTSITIPDSVTSIGDYAFYNCSGLTSITIPDSVTSIGWCAFYGCSGLTSITLPFVGASRDTTSDTHFGYIFGAWLSIENASYIPTSLKTVVITDATSIGDDAFCDCSGLTSITIPDSVTSIGNSAFSSCSGLTSITIPDSVTSIGNRAFEDCGGLTSITIPDSVTSIGNSAFYDCSGLTTITIPDSVTSIGGYAFYNCRGLTSITIPDSVTSMGYYAFDGCPDLTIYCEAASRPSGWNSNWNGSATVVWGYQTESVQAVPSSRMRMARMMRSASSMNAVAVASVEELAYTLSEDGLSYTVTGIGTVTSAELVIPSTYNGKPVTTIAANAFKNCTQLTKVTVPGSVTNIGNSAFSGCSNLESMVLPFVGGSKKTSTDTYQYPFGYIFGTSSYTGGTGVTQRYYGSSVPSTTYNTYYIPATLKSVTITGGEILYGAFSGCSSLTSITIGNGVTRIGNSAFSGCSNLERMVLPFVGGRKKTSTDTYQYPFGYIFGTSSYTGGTGVRQHYCGSSIISTTYDTYYIPATLKSVTITGGEILYGAFYNCSNLTSITIPDGVTNIGDYAFYNCSGLTSITIPDSVTSIGDWAFCGCSGLTGVYISDLSAWCNIMFDSTTSNPLYYAHNLYLNGEPVTDLIIPNGVTSIGNCAFSGCSGLTSITIPNSVTSIGSWAFYGCSGLTSITLPFVGASREATSNTHFGYIFGAGSSNYNDSYVPTSLKTVVITDAISIGQSAFYNCRGLTSVTIGNSVTSIGNSAFSSCSGLTSITIPDSVTSIGNSAFSSCSGLTSITIPDSVISIGNYAFQDCSNLMRVTVGNSVTSIGSRAFYECRNLTSVTIGNSVTSIDSYAFYGCSGLTSITIPNSVTSIGYFAFSGCSGLSSIEILNGVTSIGWYAFSGCIGLISITIPDSMTSIGYSAFEDCSGVTQIEDGIYYVDKWVVGCETSVTKVSLRLNTKGIGDSAFYGCSSLTSITIPYDLTSIGDDAFHNCYKLTSITIPDSVRSIGNSAFYNCSNLTSIAIPDSVTSVGDSAFRNCSRLTSVTIGRTVTSIGSSAFYGCSGLTNITIPDSVTSIGSYAFSDCTGLTTVSLPTSIRQLGSQAFGNCTALQTIEYAGEYLEWRFITKATDWDAGAGAYELICAPTRGLLYEMSDDAEQFYVSEYDVTILTPEAAALGVADIPDMFSGRPVVEIFERAFYNNADLREIYIPDSVTKIGSHAFTNCVNLKNIRIPMGMQTLEKGIFSGCTSLADIELPFLATAATDSETIYLGYFFGANNAKGNPSAVPSALKKLIVHGDASIAAYTFYGCESIQEIIFDGDLTAIGAYAFENCRNLERFAIPDQVSTVDIGIFTDCNNLREISIGASFVGTSDAMSILPSWGLYKPASSLERYTVSENNAKYGTDEYGVLYEKMHIGALNDDVWIAVVDAPACADLTDYILPSHIVHIYPYAFAYNTDLVSIDLEFVRMIGQYAFFEASNLINVQFGTSRELSEEDIAFKTALDGHDALTKLEYDQYVDASAFMGCSSLQRVNLGSDMLIGINDRAFFDCPSLTTVILGGSLQKLGQQVFGTSAGERSNIEQFRVVPTNEYFLSIDGVLYRRLDDGTLALVAYPAAKPMLEVIQSADGKAVEKYEIVVKEGVVQYPSSFTVPVKNDLGENVVVSLIDSYAFNDLARPGFAINLTSEHELSVGDYAFGGRVDHVHIGANVTSLGLKRGEGEYSVFANCLYLNRITVDNANPYYMAENGVLYNKNATRLIKYPAQKTEERFSVPKTVDVIASMAFKGNEHLQAVTVSSHLSAVGLEAFYNCPRLAVIFFHNAWAPEAVMENAFTTLYLSPENNLSGAVISDTVIGYSEGYYVDGDAAGEYGWCNYSAAYNLKSMTEIPEIQTGESQGYYAVVVVDENGNRIRPALDSEGNPVDTIKVSLTDPNGVTETIYVGHDKNGLGDGVATFYDLFGAVNLGFRVTFDEPYTLRVQTDDGAYFPYISENFYLDSEMRITYVTLVERPCEIVIHENYGDDQCYRETGYVGKSLSVPTLSRPGYRFMGYTTDSSCSSALWDGETATFHANKYQDVYHLYAIWEALPRVIEFRSDYPVSTKLTQTTVQQVEGVFTDSEVYLNAVTFACPENTYTFVGWYAENDPQKIYVDGELYRVGPEETNILHAVWKGVDKPLYFHTNGGTGVMESMTVTVDDPSVLTKNTFTRMGYAFSGWSTTPDGNTVAYEDGAEYTPSGSDTSPYITLYAVWTPLPNTVVFKNGEEATMPVQEGCLTDQTVTLHVGTYQKDGYILSGWSETPNGPMIASNGGQYTVRPTEDNTTTLYAVWDKPAAIYGLDCHDADINSQTFVLNKQEFGERYDESSVTLKDPSKGYQPDNIIMTPIGGETVEIRIITYLNLQNLVLSHCGLYQNGSLIQGSVVKDIQKNVAEGSATITFEVEVQYLIEEVEIEAVVEVSNGVQSVPTRRFLSINVIDFSMDEDDIHLDDTDINFDLSNAGILSTLFGSNSMKLQLGENIDLQAMISGDTVKVSLNAQYKKDWSSAEQAAKPDYKELYKQYTSGNYHGDTFRFRYQFYGPGGTEDVRFKHLTMNVYFAKGTADRGYYYYRCSVVDKANPAKPNTLVEYYGVVNAKGGRASLAIKAGMIYAAYFASVFVDKNGEKIENPDFSKGDHYIERIKIFDKAAEKPAGENAIQNSHSIGVEFYGDLEIRYSKEYGPRVVSSQIKGHISYKFEHDHQFVIWVIPVVLHIEVDVNGDLYLRLAFDDAGCTVENLRVELAAKVSATFGGGLKGVLNGGVYGNIGMVFVYERTTTQYSTNITWSGELGGYIEVMWKKHTKKWLSGDGTIYSEVKPLTLSSLYLPESYSTMTEEELSETARLLVADDQLYKLYFTVISDIPKLAIAKWDDDMYEWNEPVILDPEGAGDMDYTLYCNGESMYILYTQQKNAVTLTESGDLYDSAENSVLKFAEFHPEIGLVSDVIMLGGGNYQSLPTIETSNGTITVAWVENADNNVFGVSPKNYMDGNGISHTFPTTANSIWMKRCVNGEWQEVACVQSGLSAITEMILSEDGHLVYIVDVDGDLVSTDDRVAYDFHLSDGTTTAINAEKPGTISDLKVIGTTIVYMEKTEESSHVALLNGDENANLSLPEEFPSVSSRYRVLYGADNRPVAIIYPATKTWEDEGQSYAGDILYGIFQNNGTWGKPIELCNSVITPIENLYISAFDVVWKPGCDNALMITLEYVQDGEYVGAITAEYELSSLVSMEGDYTVQYDEQTITVELVNTGALPAEVSVKIDGVTKVLCTDLASGERRSVTIGLSGASGKPKIELINTSTGTSIAVVDDLDLNYFDLKPIVKQLLLGENNTLLVAIANNGNTVSTSGTLYIKVGVHDAMSVIDNAYQKTVSAVTSGGLVYYEIPLADLQAIEENTVITLYIVSDGDMEKESCMDNNLLHMTVKEQNVTVAGDGSSYTSEILSGDITFDSHNATDAVIRYTSTADNPIASVQIGDQMLTPDDYAISTSHEICIEQAYLMTLAYGVYEMAVVFADGSTDSITITVVAYYTISWYNADGMFLAETTVREGTVPKMDLIPTILPTESMEFVFAGWDGDDEDTEPELPAYAHKDTAYTAIFKEVSRRYEITWQVDDYTVTELYDYGTPADEVAYKGPTAKKADETYAYIFAGWDQPMSDVTGNAVYTAVYTRERLDPGREVVLDVSSQSTHSTVAVGEVTASTPAFCIDESVTVTATYTGVDYRFIGWYRADDLTRVLSGNQSYTFTVTDEHMSGDHYALVALYEQVVPVSVTVNGGKSNFTINDSEYSSESVKKYRPGTVLTVVVSDTTDFAYWKNEFGVILSRDASYTFTVVGSVSVTAVFNTKLRNKKTVIFESSYGQVLHREQLSLDELDDLIMPDVPLRTGYAAGTWGMDMEMIRAEFEKDDVEVITVTPVYPDITDTATITVQNGTIGHTNGLTGGVYLLNTILDVVADAPMAGMKFAYWTNADGRILSYNETYTLYLTKTIELTAVFVPVETEIEQIGTAEIAEVIKDLENGKVSIVSISTVPEGCKIDFAGILVSTSSAHAENLTASNAPIRVGDAADTPSYRYTWTAGNKSQKTLWARAYLVYTDEDGNAHTVYGDIIEISYD